MAEFQIFDLVKLEDPGAPIEDLRGYLVEPSLVPSFMTSPRDRPAFGLLVTNYDPRDLDGHPFPILQLDLDAGLVSLVYRVPLEGR